MDGGGSKSKKPSGANSPSKQPEEPVFFLDRSLGKHRVATALRQAGVILHIHDDHFPSDAKNEKGMACSRIGAGVRRTSNYRRLVARRQRCGGEY